MVGTEAHLRILTVDVAHNGYQGALQVAHGDVFVHYKPLDLVEHGGVGRVCLVLTEHTAGCQNADGRLGIFHSTDLHGAGLGTQQHGVVIGKIEGIAAVTGGVTLFDVQTGEVVACKLPLGTVNHLIAETDKDVLDLLQHHVHRMLMTQRHAIAGDGDIHCLLRQLCLQHCCTDGSLTLLQLGFDLSAHGIGQLTHYGTLFGAELAHHLQNSGKLTLLAQPFDPQLIQRSRCFSGIQRSQRLHTDIFQLLFHISSS